MASQRPNILFLMADQMAARFLPFHGHPVVKAPNLERLADAGVVFDSAYCNSPLCAPSRYSMLAGALPSRIDAFDNAAEFASDVPTFAHYLRRRGYRTALAGKMHFCGPDQLHGFEERLTTDIYPADYGWTPDWTRPEHRPSWYHNMLSVLQAGPCARSNQLDFDEEVAHAARRHLFDMARDDDLRPFCFVVSFTHPHDPYAILPSYWERYCEADIDLPTLSAEQAPPDPHSKRLRQVSDMDRAEITSEHVRRARRAYYGAISYIDDQVGSLLTALRDAGLDDDTIIIFTADHGDMLGERGLWYKMTWFETASRIPLIIAGRGHFKPRRVAESVSLVDLLPTLLALATVDHAADLAAPIDGRSLLPHLSGAGGHDEVIGEYLAEGAIAPLLMIRRGAVKYVCSSGDPDQLFDLTVDPEERVNLATAESHRSVASALREETAKRWNIDGLRQRVLASQARRHFVNGALAEGVRTPWDYQPRRDATRLYVRNHLALDDLEARSRLSPPA
ncbi:MAG: choline-sulfatase [Proteobacteria bacterium]|nr:choline-sulfatase [Pseudomonadota bacterium]